jgi:HK97 gp10 family phage protein
VVNVTITGWGALQANLQALSNYFSSGDAAQVSHDELLAVANDICDAARIYAPVLTGNLKAQLVVVDGGDSIEIQSNAPYSLYVEFGTVKMPAQPFFRPAFEQYGVFARLAEKHRGEIQALIGSTS